MSLKNYAVRITGDPRQSYNFMRVEFRISALGLRKPFQFCIASTNFIDIGQLPLFFSEFDFRFVKF